MSEASDVVGVCGDLPKDGNEVKSTRLKMESDLILICSYRDCGNKAAEKPSPDDLTKTTEFWEGWPFVAQRPSICDPSRDKVPENVTWFPNHFAEAGIMVMESNFTS